MEEAILGILMVLGWAALFNKKGEEWWKAIVPIYSTYLKFKLYWEVKYFIALIVLLITGFLMAFIAVIMFSIKNLFTSLLAVGIVIVVVIMALICLYIRFAFLQKVTTAQKKSFLFLIMLFLCEPVFICALAYDKPIKKFLDKAK